MSDVSQSETRNGPFTALFLEHPRKVDESYFEHMGVALRFFFWLSVAAGAALVHALIPAACEKTASNIIKRLHAKIVTRS